MIFEKKILVTGESGFIGSHLIRRLVKSYPNYDIHGLDALTYAANRSYNIDLEEHDNYHFHHINILDKKKLNDLFNKHQFSDIIHLAAESHVDNSISNPLLFAETNIIGTINLLNLFKEYSSGRFLHISTDEVYGDLSFDENPFDEKHAYSPNSPYSASKASSDHFVQAYYKTYDLDLISTNCSNNFGPHQHVEKLIPKIIYCILNDKKIPIYGDGKNIRDWLYVDDHVDALDIVFHDGVSGQKYNIGANNEISNIDLVKLICTICYQKKLHNNPQDLISFTNDRLGHDRRYAINSSKLTKNLNWKPSDNFHLLLSHTIDWYVNMFKF
ncbi:MAG: dTDP-glucose 4,6-dehydratase [Flavobacteriales bacterium]|nr:dTDP-glucose 4,6-dehydratase [Flavobacteriales bacterium]|tara:strand:- start:20217 stop:21200 length:984 start_codon:yes stop_codon:yes gene_type:complete